MYRDPSMLTDWGLSARKAGAAAGLIGAAAIAGRLLVGLLLDPVAPLVVTAGILLLVASYRRCTGRPTERSTRVLDRRRSGAGDFRLLTTSDR
jgi:hypothetical protein